MLAEARSLIGKSAALRRIVDLLRQGEALIRVDGAAASALTFVAAEIVEKEGRTVLLLLPRPDEAELFAEELEGLLGEERVFLFPSAELLPYEKHSPPEELVALRTGALQNLLRGRSGVVVSTARAVQGRVLPRSALSASLVELEVGGTVHLDELSEHLVQIGFMRGSVADEPGTFALRGGLVDLFPGGADRPVRVELLGDEIESIREYDPESQRSIRPLSSIAITTPREFPLAEGTVRRLQDLPLSGEEGERLKRGVHFEGIERYLPLLFPDAETLFDYLPTSTVALVLEEREVLSAASEFWEEAERFYESSGKADPLPAPAAAFLDPRKVEARLRDFSLLLCRRGSVDPASRSVALGAAPAPATLGQMDLLRKEVAALLSRGFRVFIVCDREAQAARLEEALDDFAGAVAIGLGKLRRGFVLAEEKIALLADHEIFRRLRRPRLERPRPRGTTIESYLALKEGDYVVHVTHGIGRFQGVERITMDGVSRDCVLLRYAGGDRLYVPTDQMDQLQKYSGSEGGPPAIDKIGGTSWARTRAKAKKAVRKMAEGLLRLYAARQAKGGHPFSPDGPWQRELEASFLYEETEHQIRAWEDVKRDMESARAMDRLVCGDVGYGKTEIAVRAAFKAVMDHKQVAVLVPTTLLAHQHHRTFNDRFAGFPIRVEVLSRFQRPKEIARILADLSDGKVDVVIGTHRLLQKDIVFHDLGLVVVDEEQRFGVSQKEKLKRIRETVDVLTLTATPIPRTLHMSLAGARDISIIDTPPKDRLPIVTEVIVFEPKVIEAAILREIDRGGQVYFVHNRVQSIDSMAAYLVRLIPEARVGVAHGQMTGRRLEEVMLRFLEREIDLLVSTMIVESGLDIPSVNTMLINRSDHFGLAQLYQLRGRVGRSKHRAYTYLIVPKERRVTEDAEKRLEAIATHTDLGSGYRIAMKDLEIRGAGNLLGAEQHGFVASVGFEMYCKLLEEAVREIRGEEPPARAETRVEAGIDSYLPDSYVGDRALKVVLYRRLAETRTPEDVHAIREEVVDRFGKLPGQASHLFTLREIKLLGEKVGAESVRIGEKRIRVRFPDGRVSGKKEMERLLRVLPRGATFDAARGLLIEVPLGSGEEGIGAARKMLSAAARSGNL